MVVTSSPSLPWSMTVVTPMPRVALRLCRAKASPLLAKYGTPIDRESAREILTAKMNAAAEADAAAEAAAQAAKAQADADKELAKQQAAAAKAAAAAEKDDAHYESLYATDPDFQALGKEYPEFGNL